MTDRRQAGHVGGVDPVPTGSNVATVDGMASLADHRSEEPGYGGGGEQRRDEGPCSNLVALAVSMHETTHPKGVGRSSMRVDAPSATDDGMLDRTRRM